MKDLRIQLDDCDYQKIRQLLEAAPIVSSDSAAIRYLIRVYGDLAISDLKAISGRYQSSEAPKQLDVSATVPIKSESAKEALNNLIGSL